MISIVCNGLRQPCGCVTWQQWSERGARWVPMAFICWRHRMP